MASAVRTTAPPRPPLADLDARHAADQLRVDPTSEVDMGLEFASGLDSPDLETPEPPAALWLQSTAPAGSALGGRPLHDGVTMIPKKLKTAPNTQAEMKDCQAALSPEQLAKVSVGPKVLDFGTVCVDSSTARCFSVHNSLADQCVLVVLKCDAPDLADSTPLSQVVPPGKLAGFDIIFKPTAPQVRPRGPPAPGTHSPGRTSGARSPTPSTASMRSPLSSPRRRGAALGAARRLIARASRWCPRRWT
jgi:hypothetical protein